MSLILSGTNGLSDVDGSAATPAIRGTDSNTGIFFPAADTIAFAEGGVEAMRIDSSGNVGIGTSSPGRKLMVYDASGATISLNNAATGTTAASGFQLQNGSGGDAYIWNYSNSFIAIGTNNVERARIDSSGNFFVGTTLTGSKQNLQFDNSGQGGIRIIHSSATYNGSAMQFLRANNSTSMGNIYCDGANTSYNTSSDYRLKENIQPMGGGLDKVMRLKPCTYKWKDMDKTGEGFIAHELQEVVPAAVHGEKDAVNEDGSIKAQSIDTSFLVATLTAAIQELSAKVDAQAAEIAALKGAQA